MHRGDLPLGSFSTFPVTVLICSHSWFSFLVRESVGISNQTRLMNYPTGMMQCDNHSPKGPWLVELVDFKSTQLFLSV